LPTIAGVVAGMLSLRPLFGAIDARGVGETPEAAAAGFDRRRFLITATAFGGAAAVAGIASRFASAATRRAVASRALLRVPKPSDAARNVAGTDLRVTGLSSFRTPNATFYRVDTALLVPKIRAEDWRLRIHGMVDREITMDIGQLLARPLIERDITLACVSNEVGGGYIGNARWIGAPLKPILEEAGVHKGADQLVSRSADGFKHGFPVRMVVPGLYGYVSATKWLVEMELTTFDAFDAYWISRGWAKRAPIKTMSRIDTPRSSQDLRAGDIPIAGIAWAQHKGIASVEVRIDDGPWQRAESGAEDTIDTWRQWVYRWKAARGDHTIVVRATDKTGYTQTAQERAPIPDGATGWHTIHVTVS
jgi:DMSO/TMAO reductase YedYZ molybdopterin-dependent catalytic subunit